MEYWKRYESWKSPGKGFEICFWKRLQNLKKIKHREKHILSYNLDISLQLANKRRKLKDKVQVFYREPNVKVKFQNPSISMETHCSMDRISSEAMGIIFIKSVRTVNYKWDFEYSLNLSCEFCLNLVRFQSLVKKQQISTT